LTSENTSAYLRVLDHREWAASDVLATDGVSHARIYYSRNSSGLGERALVALVIAAARRPADDLVRPDDRLRKSSPAQGPLGLARLSGQLR
jgi:hypothetical protein